MASETINKTMYGGSVNIQHNPFAKGSQPRYLVNGTKRIKGVTTILGQTLAKDLMQWAVDCAMQYLTAKLPTVTPNDLVEAANEYKVRRDSGASTGTDAHAMVEQFLKGQAIQSASSQESQNAFGAFVTWFEAVKPEVINVEEVIYSVEHEYAGTYDAMLRINDKVYLTDLKTTNASRRAPNGVYAENFIQLGAYAAAHEEQRKYEEANGGSKLPKVEGLAVISAKKDGKLDFVTNADVGLTVAECGELFHQVVNIYRTLATTTKELGGR